MAKLGIIQDEEAMDEQARKAYDEVFERSLTKSEFQALVKLFGLQMPDRCTEQNTDLQANVGVMVS